MNWEQTVMSDEQIRVLSFGCYATAEDRWKAMVEAQAKLSYEAGFEDGVKTGTEDGKANYEAGLLQGRREVVEFIKMYNPTVGSESHKQEFLIDIPYWQAQLQKWGLDAKEE